MEGFENLSPLCQTVWGSINASITLVVPAYSYRIRYVDSFSRLPKYITRIYDNIVCPVVQTHGL